MKVYIELGEWYSKFTNGKRNFELDCDEGTSVFEIISSTGIPIDEIGITTVNSEIKDSGWIAMNGDRIKVYPMIIGG